MDIKVLAKPFIIIGVLFLVVGIIIFVTSKYNIKIPFGNLPGDIKIKNGNTSVFIPITTCIVGSLILSFLLWLINLFTK